MNLFFALKEKCFPLRLRVRSFSINELLEVHTTTPSTVIDSVPLLVSFVDSLVDVEPKNANSSLPVYLDLEGDNLGRNGSLTMIQALVYPLNHGYLIDVLALGEKTFSTKGSNGETFKGIHESGVSANHQRSVGQDT